MTGRSWTLRFPALGLTCAVALASVGTAHAACTPIRHSPFLEPYEAGVIEPLVYRQPGRREVVRWGAARFDAPHDGTVYVFDCSGRTVAELRLGYVLGWREGPMVEGVPTVETRYVGGTGTGVWTSWVSLLQYRDGKLLQLWSHVVTDSFAGPPEEAAERHRWRYLDGGRRILVTGVRASGPIRSMRQARAAGPTHRLRNEFFCYVAASTRYAPCDQPAKE